MKKLALLALALTAASSFAQTHVDGYIKRDGTYVAPHVRSNPNSTKIDNYSSQGNSNPYTGQSGSVNPYAQPSYQAPSYQAPTYQTPSYGSQPVNRNGIKY